MMAYMALEAAVAEVKMVVEVSHVWIWQAILDAGHPGSFSFLFFFQAEDGIRDDLVTGVQTCALPISTPAMPAAAGMVSSHAQTIRPATPQRTADNRCAAPTPDIAPVMVCVVLTGMPKCDATNSVIAPLASAQKPPNGWSLVRRWPIVLTMRQPPDIVPSPIDAPPATMTHTGTDASS